MKRFHFNIHFQAQLSRAVHIAVSLGGIRDITIRVDLLRHEVYEISHVPCCGVRRSHLDSERR